MKKQNPLKRYWKIALLQPLIFLSIGTYYVQAAGMLYPNFYVKTLEGDAREASPIRLEGSYQTGKHNNASMAIDPKGSNYYSERTFLEQLDNQFRDPATARLLREHRNFMRGKTDFSHSFYEDDKTLAYANVKADFDPYMGESNRRFQISYLDKKTKETRSFEVPLPKAEEYEHLFVTDVQASEREVQALTLNYPKKEGAENKRPMPRLYRFDTDQGVLSEDILLFDKEPQPGRTYSLTSAMEVNPTGPSRYIVYPLYDEPSEGKVDKETEEPKKPESGRKQSLFVYNLEAGKEEKVEDPVISEVLADAPLMVAKGGDGMFLLQTLPAGLRVVHYDPGKGKVTKDYTIPSAELYAEGRTVVSIQVTETRLYLLLSSPEPVVPQESDEVGAAAVNKDRPAPAIVMADLDSGRIEYRGIVAIKGKFKEEPGVWPKFQVYSLFLTDRR